MDKLRKTWMNNRILFILLGILIICFIAICIVAATYFFKGSASNYGNRLQGIENYPVSDDAKNTYLENIKKDESVKDATIKVSGKIIYISIYYNSGLTLDEGESKALKSLDSLSDDLKSFYDLIIYIESDDSDTLTGFKISGAKNTGGSGLIWNNNKEIVVEE